LLLASEWRGWSYGGGFLILIAVCCALDWTTRLELSLGVWAPLSHCCSTVLRCLQGHLVFQDFRWSADDGIGLLVGKSPGVHLYLCGATVLFGVLLLYVLTYDENEWLQSEGLQEEPERRTWRWTTRNVMALFMEAAGVVAFLYGVNSPVYTYEICPPTVYLVGSIAREFGTQDCIVHAMDFWGSITWFYDNRMPFSAMLVAYRSVIGPIIEFILLAACHALDQVPQSFRDFLVSGARSKWATNVMVQILYVAIIRSCSDYTGVQGRVQFGTGFYAQFLYVLVYGMLARALPEAGA